MSYRFEKEANGEYALVISRGPNEGIADAPYLGFNGMYSVNLNTPGETSVGYGITTSTTSGATLGVPIARSTSFLTYGSQTPVGDPQFYAILDANGRVWQSSTITGTFTFLSTGESHTGATSNDGLAYWLGYLFKTRGVNIDYYNGSTWSNAWSTALTATVKHYMYVGTDNVLYITNGSFVTSIALTNPGTPSSFDPTNAATYTVTATRLQIATNDMALSLAEIGGGNTSQSTLLVGGSAHWVYPWDKTSPSFSLPIYVADPYIKNIVSVNQNAFIFPGSAGNGRGRIYITNGSQAEVYKKIPDYLFNIQDPYFEWGDAISHRNNLVFGFFVDANASPFAVQLTASVWAIDLTTKELRAISSIPVSNAKGSATVLLSGENDASPGFGYILGWDDNASTPGIGYSGTTAGVGTGTIFTDLMPVGSFTIKKTFSQVEYKLRTALQSGEDFQVFPLSDGTGPGALTFNPTPTTGTLSGYASVNWQNGQWLQFQVSLTGNSASSGVRFEELRLR